jgi:hypothetical protein
MSRTSPLPPLSSLPPPDWTDSFGAAAPSESDEGPIFLCGLDDLLIRLESSPDYHPSATSGDTLEALTDLLVDAGITR